MVWYGFTILSLLLLVLLVYFKYKDILCPPFVLTFIYFLVFLFFLIFKIIFNSKYSLNIYCLYFAIGQLVFILFYNYTFSIVKISDKIVYKNAYSLTIIYKILLFAQILVFVYFFCDMFFKTFNIYGYNMMARIAKGKNIEYEPNYFIRIVRTFSFSFAIISVHKLIYKNNRMFFDNIFLIMQILIALLFLLFQNSRQWTFILFVPVFFVILKSLGLNKKNLLFCAILLSFLFIIFIGIQAYIVNGTASLEFLRLYLVSGIVAFTEWVNKPFDMYYGKYTFRFVLSILKRLHLININVPYLPMSYLDVPSLDWSTELGNVYTFYYGYVKDFGLLYGLFIQGIVGAFHAFLYKKTFQKYNYSFWVLICSLFYMPLVVHFFMDHYFSHFSLWLQMVIPILLVFKTNLLFKWEKNV